MTTALTVRPGIHPGEMLLEEFLKPEGLSQIDLARGTGIPASRINMIINRKLGLSAETALRFSRFFNTTVQLWLNMQNDYEVQTALKANGAEIMKVRAYEPPAAEVVTPTATVITGRASRPDARPAHRLTSAHGSSNLGSQKPRDRRAVASISADFRKSMQYSLSAASRRKRLPAIRSTSVVVQKIRWIRT